MKLLWLPFVVATPVARKSCSMVRQNTLFSGTKPIRNVAETPLFALSQNREKMWLHSFITKQLNNDVQIE